MCRYFIISWPYFCWSFFFPIFALYKKWCFPSRISSIIVKECGVIKHLWFSFPLSLTFDKILNMPLRTHPWRFYQINQYVKAYSELCETSKMGRFAKIVNSLKTVNYFCKPLHLKCLTGFWIRLCIWVIWEMKKLSKLLKIYFLCIFNNRYTLIQDLYTYLFFVFTSLFIGACFVFTWNNKTKFSCTFSNNHHFDW